MICVDCSTFHTASFREQTREPDMGDVVRFSRCTTIIGRLVPHLALFLQETAMQSPERASMWVSPHMERAE